MNGSWPKYAASSAARTSIKLSAASGASVEIGFEPIGTSFELAEDESIFLELPIDAVAELQIVSWHNGMAVWVPYPGDYVVYDAAGNVLDRL